MERLPKNFPALQERMETVKHSGIDKQKQQLTPHPSLENPAAAEKDESFFLL